MGGWLGDTPLQTIVPIGSPNDAQASGVNHVDSTADQAVIEVRAYDPSEYARFGLKDGELCPQAPIVDNANMAIVNLDMSHRHYYEIDLIFDDGEQANIVTDKSFNTPVVMKFIIEGGQLRVDVPNLKVRTPLKALSQAALFQNDGGHFFKL